MVISDVVKYKNKIMNKICSIPEILELINNPEISPENPDDMKNVNVFSRMKIPNIATNVKNYICFDYNEKTDTYNKTFKNVIINIGIVCHEDDIVTDYGNRHDVIAGVIEEYLNWSDFLGYVLELVSNTESILNNTYHVRTLVFKNVATNNINSGVRNDANR